MEMGAQQSPLTELQLMVPIELDVQAMQTSNEVRGDWVSFFYLVETDAVAVGAT